MVMGVCLRRFCLRMSVVWTFVWSELGQGTTGCSGKCFGVMYCEWYGVCDYVGVNVFHVCLCFGVVYGVGIVSLSVV